MSGFVQNNQAFSTKDRSIEQLKLVLVKHAHALIPRVEELSDYVCRKEIVWMGNDEELGDGEWRHAAFSYNARFYTSAILEQIDEITGDYNKQEALCGHDIAGKTCLVERMGMKHREFSTRDRSTEKTT
ncbi:hypothetical protein Bbelb_238260 [Branchiostoma belcheri]|nr:hypothetical protein Bbelb_238260 [Branchiostoma belcheri]